MSLVPTRRPRRAAGLALILATLVALVGCSTAGAPSTSPTASAPAAASWPRSFTNTDGSVTTIPKKPERIVSTTVTATGTLLSIDAPVVASGSAANGKFFGQWAATAEQKSVANIFPVGKVDIEAVIAQNPDLIVVARGGADSLIDNVAELSAVAPTIVIDYGVVTWQELAQQFGTATGREAEAAAAVADYDKYVKDAAAKIKVPAGKANIFSFNGPGENNNIARVGSVHGDVLTSLGFTLEDPPVAWHTSPEQRSDFVFATYENLTELTAETSFILARDDEGAKAFAEDPAMANVPSVKAGQVYGLGRNSFRVDKFSAIEIVDHVVELFGK
ncbi:MAG: Fe2+-enterobactin ABC transporter substrate-binding protein [Propioniciclava sp.]|uniref:Fe2+-enterobactin ABC transporter substrate-binding protein n=1 Tax=Propioniciclava sp. TaxID=2038686 RepID=UPI0039E682DB